MRQHRTRESCGCHSRLGGHCGCLPAFLFANWALVLLSQLEGDSPFPSSHRNSILLASDWLTNVHHSILTNERRVRQGLTLRDTKKIYCEWDAMNYCNCKLMVRGTRLRGQLSLHRKARNGWSGNLRVNWTSCTPQPITRDDKCPPCSSQLQLSVSSAGRTLTHLLTW